MVNNHDNHIITLLLINTIESRSQKKSTTLSGTNTRQITFGQRGVGKRRNVWLEEGGEGKRRKKKKG